MPVYSHSSAGIVPLSELSSSLLQQRHSATSDTRARALPRPRSQPHSLAHGLRDRHAVSHLAPSLYTPTPMPHPLHMYIGMYAYTYM